MTLRNGPLDGVKVTDFTWIGAGSFTTKLLADMGADVVKLETATRPDTLRMMPPFKDKLPGVNRSGYFADRNTSKRSVALNMKTPKARDIARQMIAQSHIVINNFTPDVMPRFGLGWEDVRKFKPDIVYVAMSLLGASGPERDYLGYGHMINAMSGLLRLSGHPDREPTGTGTNYPDHIPNPTHAVFALLAALRHLRRTGEGQFVDVAQLEPAVALLGPTVLEWTVNGVDRKRVGNAHDTSAPHGVYPTKGDDRWLALAIASESQWVSLARVLGHLEWLDNVAWRDAAGRRADRSALDEVLGKATRERSGTELMEALQRDGGPAGVVQDASDVIDDPQLVHRGQWVHLEHPEMGRSLYSAPPMQFSVTPAWTRRPAPLLGEHTREVCHEWLSLDDQEIDALIAEEVLK
ncbi:MAG: CoA-transferase [Novosphingobium sp.]|nr:CoA-transferase [Novosphingobium sp.]